MQRPQQYKAKVIQKNQISSKVTKIKFQYISPSEMNFIPGQFVNLKCSDVKYRAYSIASTNSDKNHMTLLIETGHDGLGSNYAKKLKTGDTVEFIGPSGKLHFSEVIPQNLVFYATGTGIAPFLSMFHQLVKTDYKGKVYVVAGFRKEEHALELAQLDYFSTKLPNFKYKVYYSQPEDPAVSNKGYVTDELAFGVDRDACYLVCGHPKMVEDVQNILLENGIDKTNIMVEEFTHSRTG